MLDYRCMALALQIAEMLLLCKRTEGVCRHSTRCEGVHVGWHMQGRRRDMRISSEQGVLASVGWMAPQPSWEMAVATACAKADAWLPPLQKACARARAAAFSDWSPPAAAHDNTAPRHFI